MMTGFELQPLVVEATALPTEPQSLPWLIILTQELYHIDRRLWHSCQSGWFLIRILTYKVVIVGTNFDYKQ